MKEGCKNGMLFKGEESVPGPPLCDDRLHHAEASPKGPLSELHSDIALPPNAHIKIGSIHQPVLCCFGGELIIEQRSGTSCIPLPLSVIGLV